MDVMFRLDDAAFARLQECATHEERTPDAQAKILVLKGLDVYTEFRPKSAAAKPRPKLPVKSSREGVNGAGVVPVYE
jgi:hypothetical protein